MKLFHGVSCFYTQNLPRIVLNDLLLFMLKIILPLAYPELLGYNLLRTSKLAE